MPSRKPPPSPPPLDADSPPASPNGQPTDPPSTSPGAAPSGGSSRGSPRGRSPFVADPGPAFDARREQASSQPAPEPEAPALEQQLFDQWDEERVRAILTAQGFTVHALFGVAERDWVYTEADLETIAPPLARILNRYDLTRAAAHVGDEAAVAMGLGGYVVRSVVARRAALKARELEPDRPVTGFDADGQRYQPPTNPPEAPWNSSPS
jgi:hypothetical protein